MSYYVSGYYQEKAILKKEGQLFFLKMRGSGCTDWYNGARKHGQIDNGTSRKRNNRKFVRFMRVKKGKRR